MTQIDIRALTRHVRAILADPHAETATTGSPSLDAALAALSLHHRSGQPLEAPHALGFWYSPPERADVHR